MRPLVRFAVMILLLVGRTFAAECETVAYVIRSDDSGKVLGVWRDLRSGDVRLQKGSAICRDSKIVRGDPKSENDLLRLRVIGQGVDGYVEYVCRIGQCDGDHLPMKRLLPIYDAEPPVHQRTLQQVIRFGPEQPGWLAGALDASEPLDPRRLQSPTKLPRDARFAWCPNYLDSGECPKRPAPIAPRAEGLLPTPGVGLHLLRSVQRLRNGADAYGSDHAWVLVLPSAYASHLPEIRQAIAQMDQEGVPRSAVGYYLARQVQP